MFTENRKNWINEKFGEFFSRMPLAGEKVSLCLKDMTENEQLSMKYTYAFMPVSDVLTCSTELIEEFVKHGVMLYETVSWLKDTPIDIFLPFVLFYRINNEAAEPYRQEIYNSLYPRIKEMGAREAALEANYWCAEHATYLSTDDRTLSASAVLRRGFGRCGEESTLLCCVLRSIGVPARQCYTPRWAHCDDNHAWVETYIDGMWHYMGACEPEPVLNKGWFTSAASKAMLVYSRGFIDGINGESVICKSNIDTTFNSLPTYAETKEISIKVTQNGKAAKDVLVRLEIANAGEFYPITSLKSDNKGYVKFITGVGNLLVHATDGVVFAEDVIDVRVNTELTIDLGKPQLQNETEIIEMTPPKGLLTPPQPISADINKKHEQRFKENEKKRNNRNQGLVNIELAEQLCRKFPGSEKQIKEVMAHAKGNCNEIGDFLSFDGFSIADKLTTLDTLREKDFVDTTAQCLIDCLATALPYSEKYPEDIYKKYILCPRVENEKLYAHRKDVLVNLKFETGEQVWKFITENTILMDDYDYPNLYASPQGILEHGISTTHNNDVLFVQICRSMGIPARLSPITGEKEVYSSGKFTSILVESENNSLLTLINDEGKPLTYGVQFTISRLINGIYQSLKSENNILENSLNFSLPSGVYRVMTMARQIDGSALCKIYNLNLEAKETKTLKIGLCKDKTKELLKYAELPNYALKTQEGREVKPLESIGSNGGVLCFGEPGKEPTEHFFREVIDLADEYNNRQLNLFIILNKQEELKDNTLQTLIQRIKNITIAVCPGESYSTELRKIMGEGDERKPFIVAVNEKGQGLFAFANYNVGTALTVLNIFDSI